MTAIYGKLFFFVLVVRLYSILLYFGVNSELPLLDNVKLNVKTFQA